MILHARTRERRPMWTIALLAAAVAFACILTIWRPWQAPSAPAAGAVGAVAAVAPAVLALPATPRVLIFGDSWTYGSAATDPSLGYAHVVGEKLDWDVIVDGVRGSGYLKPGLDGGTFGERIADLAPEMDPDLVIVQGSINDRRLGAIGYRDAVTAAWDALSATYPESRIVILGPAPQVLPVEPATARIDADLRDLANARGWWYLSPVVDEWITAADYLEVIDTSAVGNDHPSTAGHAYLASRLADAIAAISATTDAAAAPAVAPLVP